jgi:hypothetical protein
MFWTVKVDLERAANMSPAIGQAYKTLGALSRNPLVRTAYEQRLIDLVDARSEVMYELQPIMEEKDRQLASQANQLAAQSARIAELERQLAAK